MKKTLIKLSISILFSFSVIIGQLQKKVFLVKTGSMEPEIPKHSLILLDKRKNYEINDIITYKTNMEKVITHRIITKKFVNKKQLYELKGDKNLKKDPYPVVNNEIIGKVKYIIKPPNLYYIFTKKRYLWATVYTPCGLLIGFLINRINSTKA